VTLARFLFATPALLALLWSAATLHAQTPAGNGATPNGATANGSTVNGSAAKPSPPPPQAPAPVVDDAPPAGRLEAKPEVFYLRDKSGRLQPVVGFTLEKFEEMLLKPSTANGSAKRPDFRFESVAATGTADDSYARLEVKFVVHIDAAGWVRVPLDLQGSVLEKYADYRGPGSFAMQYDTDRREYIAWIQGEGDKPHELTLKTITPLETVAGRRRLRLSVPKAWSSSLAVTVPEADVVAQTSPGTILEAVEKNQKQSTIKARGVGGVFQLTWGAAETASRKLQVLLEAQADLLATVDGRSVAYETELTVNSFGGEFDRFEVQLPPSSVLVEEELVDLELTKRPPKDKNDKTTVYEVRRTSGPAKTLTVKLKALRSLEQNKGQTTFDFGGFEVLDAVRQWGYLGVVLEDDWQIQWLDLNRIRQVDASPSFLQGRNVASVFEYYGRPFTLQARVTPRETRVSVDPEYLVDVTPQRLFLQARLRYRVGGAKVFAFAVDLQDWQVDEVGPAQIVNTGAVVLGQTAPLTIPLGQPSAGEFEITIRAHRDLAADAKEASFTVPKPRANVVGPATLTVHAADNVELSPRDSLHTGLVRRKRADMLGGTQGRTTWSYGVDAAGAKFTADVRTLQRSIQVKCRTQLSPARDGGSAVQKFEYTVAREPIDALSFDVPARLTDKGNLSLELAGKPVPWVVVEEDVGGGGKPSRIRVNLPAAQVGEFELEARYELPEEQLPPQASVALKLPLLAPAEGELVENRLSISPATGITVQHVDPVFAKSSTAVTAGGDAQAIYSARTAPAELTVGVRWDEPVPPKDVVVERLWIQSIDVGPVRQERAVFRLSTAAAALELRLPPGSAGLSAELDGQAWEIAEPAADGSQQVRLPPSTGEREYVLDLRYRTARGDVRGELALPTPTLAHLRELRYVYRQVVLPTDAYVLTASADYIPEFAWSWRDLFLVRRPLLQQADLETWSGARHDTPIPDRANQYLYSGFGAAPSLELKTAHRTTVVLAAAGGILLYCLALLYLAPLRRPALVLVVACAALTLGVLYPDAAPLALQAALFGLALSFTALVLDRNVSRRRGRTVRQVLDPSSVGGVQSTRTRITAAYVPSPASTATTDRPGSAAAASNVP
jgi:hypothetical protein